MKPPRSTGGRSNPRPAGSAAAEVIHRPIALLCPSEPATSVVGFVCTVEMVVGAYGLFIGYE